MKIRPLLELFERQGIHAGNRSARFLSRRRESIVVSVTCGLSDLDVGTFNMTDTM